MEKVSGFSKLSKQQKIDWLAGQFSDDTQDLVKGLTRFWNQNVQEQKRFDEFSENTLTNYYLPFGIAPNFLINNRLRAIPMVIEESSVVAAASLAAKFWLARGGFKAEVLDMLKVGHVHFMWQGDGHQLSTVFDEAKELLLNGLAPLSANMEKRGGGIRGLALIDKTHELANYWQLELKCETCDAMGANFINTLLEELARLWKIQVPSSDIVMCILSNYTPECLVKAYVTCPVDDLGVVVEGMSPEQFAERFVTAVNIARADRSRAVTHNKGIMNGVDAVILATGNDFRAVEGCLHAYAARDGQYRSLSQAKIEDEQFIFSIELPLALGTVGGLTSLHPLAKTSLAIMENPSARELMEITACVGLAQNFAAVKSLITTGIQRGHMKLHLLNILHQLGAYESTKEAAKDYFTDKIVSYSAVREFVQSQQGLH